MSMPLLGDDGRGYELARKLESCGLWRAWLGDSYYSTFIHSLASPAAWESFMRVDDSKSKSQIHLQLRARALLFDKASISLFLPSNQNSSSVSKLNPYYLQLHGDDVYFTLESNSQDGVQHRESGVASNASSSKSQSKPAFSSGSRYAESEFDNLSQRHRNEELPETWYDQFIEKYRVSRPYKLSLGDLELDKRTPEKMSAYLTLAEKNKRRRVPFQDDQYTSSENSVVENASYMHPNSALDVSSSTDADIFLPEMMFPMNCVPDTAVLQISREEMKQKVEFNGVLDTLPQVTTKSPVMIERLGIRPECLGMEQGGSSHHGNIGSEGNKKYLSEEQASQLSQKVIARMLTGVGFEGISEIPLEVFSELLGSRICKLGRTLKILSDSYRKQCSAVELLKMFLQVTGYSNLGSLVELVKDGTRNIVQQSQQQVHGMQSQLQSQQQSPLRLPQQMPRQMHQQMVQPQNLAFQQMPQQQLERLRMRQPSTPRPGMDMDKDRPVSQVNAENSSKLTMDANAFNASTVRQSQMQFRQQQLHAMSNLQAQSSNQFRQLTSVQIPQMQSPNMGIVRAPPVKVEGFQELMGGDASLKHESEENKLTSPTSK